MNGSPELWTDEFLTENRQVGDPLADRLAEKLFSPSEYENPFGGRLGYNPILDLADILCEDPELAFTKHSEMADRLGDFDPELRDYYHPEDCPAWVDKDKLDLASKVWEENSFPIVIVLYAASLPACYMIKKGIPALYDTTKLTNPTYIFQRIFETALFVEQVLNPEGLKIVNDVGKSATDVLVEALNELDPQGDWQLAGTRIQSAAGHGKHFDKAEVRDKIAEIQSRENSRRFVWGKGYITAKKVRMLHASMRYMLCNPVTLSNIRNRTESGCPFHVSATEPQTFSEKLLSNEIAWPVDELGLPVCQEDLAYTLLTFAYLIPKGLERWGATLSREEKEAFLHLWKLVGHTLGVRSELMTDNWDDAEYLFNRIVELECGRSEDGIVLTNAVTGFIKSYLPGFLGLKRIIPVMLIVNQLGWDRASSILSDADQKVAKSFYTRFLQFFAYTFARVYYRLYQGILKKIPVINGLLQNMFERSTDELIESWRSAYWRKPYYVPDDAKNWVKKRGADPEFEQRLHKWRVKVFVGVMVPSMTLGLSLISTIAWGAMKLGNIAPEMQALTGWTALGTLFVTAMMSDIYLPRVYKSRPTVDLDEHAVGAISDFQT